MDFTPQPKSSKEIMMNWWETTTDAQPAAAMRRAVAYYRHSAQDRQENSIPIQREQVRTWAQKNRVEIIHEFEDAGKSGLDAEGRPAFTDMMESWVKMRTDFEYVVCLDVSRWGRFQDLDLSAHYCGLCKQHGKQVVYATIGTERMGEAFYPVYISLERYRAAEYSRELSTKVLNGCIKIAQQGYWAGGKPPYAYHRLLLNERRDPERPLNPGERKSIQNQRVTLIEGEPKQVAVILRIFYEFVKLRYSEYLIAERLNADGIPSPGGKVWTGAIVAGRLCNEKYAGTMLYNQTTQKLKTPSHQNPPELWVRTPQAFRGLVDPELFLQAQEIFTQRRRKYLSEVMLAELEALYERFGMLRVPLLGVLEDVPSPATFSNRFGGLDLAFQQMYREPCNRARQLVHDQIRRQIPGVLSYSDFLVVDQKLTISVQPAVPFPNGYDAYWPFRPDRRRVIDITLGVLLSDPEQLEILGYVALPRWLAGRRRLRISSNSAQIEMFGRCILEFLQQLL
jgi:DNA invertase Pin-like site-specific DNA recombinase